MSDTVLDRAYLAMQAAHAAMEDGCDCGCIEDARQGLATSMREIEAVAPVPQTGCCDGGCTCK